METKKKIIIIVSLIFLLIFIGVGIWVYQSLTAKTPQPAATIPQTSDSFDATSSGDSSSSPTDTSTQTTPPERSTEELNSYVIQTTPSLIDSSTNLPKYTIVDKQEPLEGWYVLTIRNTTTDTSDANIVLHDVDGKLTKVAGPGTGLFNRTDLPEEVRKAMKKS
jgi:cytoskeletal protein RodZ